MINLSIGTIFGLENIPSFKKGSGIHIKKKNRGKFTKSAKAAGESVQEHAAHVLSDPNATPLLKKRANFARNAAKWHHKEGGILKGLLGIVTPEMELARYQGEVTPAKTFGDKVLDVGNAISQFIPFIGTAQDAREGQGYAAASGSIRDIAIPGFIKAGNAKDLGRRRRGWDRKWHRNPNYGKPMLPPRFMRGAAKTLGLAGLILDTPNIVADYENLKRALGFNYNHLLLMKE